VEGQKLSTPRTFEDLTPEQQEKLTALLDRLQSSPSDELIVHCAEAIGESTSGADLVRVDAAMAGAWANNRMMLYLERLRLLNDERRQLGDNIHQLLQHPYPTTEGEVKAAAFASVLAPHLAGQQEVVLNFICVSIQHIRSLLKIVAEAVEYEIPEDDLEFLDKFRHLRNHFEHWYERLPGKTHESVLVQKTRLGEQYYIRGGLEADEQDRVIVIEPKKSGPVRHVVDVTNNGMARVEKIVRETKDEVRTQALNRVRDRYIADPTDVPSPDSVRQDLLFSVGGYGASGRQRKPSLR
jgi:hypothetical protein